MLKRLVQEMFGMNRPNNVGSPAPAPSPVQVPVSARPTAPVSDPEPESAPHYSGDGLTSYHNHDFIREPEFAAAYARGIVASGVDYYFHWRVHVGLWAAQCAARLPGDFVECGVNYGFLSSAIMQRLDWNSLDKTFYLLDSFQGADENLLTEGEREDGALDRNRTHLDNGFYVTGAERARRNFAEWQRVSIIEGMIPGTLRQIGAKKIAFLHLDLNAAEPEVAAAEYFWDKLVPGAMVLLDDYAYLGYHHQKAAMDRFARDRNVPIVSLPTGQGLIVVA